MLLALNVNNTNIKLALYRGRSRLVSWRIATERQRTADEYAMLWQQLFAHHGFRFEDVTGVAPGDAVFGTCRGSFAQYTAAKASRLAAKPASLTFEQAAALPNSANTALRAVRDKAKVRPGQHVLVIGAGGGVGTFAVQLARH